MKFINVIFGMIFSVAVYSIFSISLRMNLNLGRTLKDARNKKTSQEFIARSFRNCTKGIGFENLNEWQSQCRALWNLEYIAWSNAEDFMKVSYEESSEPLFYGVWKDSTGIHEVYSRRKN